MTLCVYQAPFDVSLITGTVTVTQTGAPGEADVIDIATLTTNDNQATPVASSIFWHWDLVILGAHTAYHVEAEDETAQKRHRTIAGNSLANALAIAVNAAWGPTFTCIYDYTTGFYTFGASEAFSVTFSTHAVRRLFGFSSLSLSSATSHVGTFYPTYTIPCELQAVSVDGSAQALNYEPRGIANHPIADDGTGYGISRTVSPLYRDWIQQFEPPEKCERRRWTQDTDTNNWTFQHLFEYCRGHWPILVSQGFGNSVSNFEVFSLRDESTIWNPSRATAGDDSHFHIPFMTHVDGRFVAT